MSLGHTTRPGSKFMGRPLKNELRNEKNVMFCNHFTNILEKTGVNF